ncbi:prepilin-type N-terminal cleavage/methylation domain-containing protein [Candidatus Roizmanbacteria bacterium]|nr:prepilin-type N-terminal cleavage/methylation domain-containing protein [Candidatus Roizmanbacteria bacterium]
MSKSGFSLTELLISVAVLAVITGIGATTYIDQLSRGRDQQRQADVARLQSALERYRAEHGEYINEGFGCESSIGQYGFDCLNGTGSNTNWDGAGTNPLQVLVTEGYLEELPIDPINNAEHHYGYDSGCTAADQDDVNCGRPVICEANTCCSYQISFRLESGDGTRVDVCNP